VSTVSPSRRNPTIFPSIVAFLILFLAVLGAFLYGKGKANRGFETVFEGLVKKSELASDMQVKLFAAAEAEKSSVMADTDEASVAFAEEARRASAAVEADRTELGRLIEMAKRPEEQARFNEFSTCWTGYQELDRQILDLAVQNTNLKALRLSFAPASKALDRMQVALDKLVDDSAASGDAAAIAKAAGRALAAALKIHVLESRHIPEARDEEMETIEADMKALDARVSQGLSSLATSTGEVGKAAVDEASTAYADFQKVNAEVVDLSRRNSNVRSLAMSLGQKRKVTAQCQDLLTALQEVTRSERFKATR
jgi:hypothetical protein